MVVSSFVRNGVSRPSSAIERKPNCPPLPGRNPVKILVSKGGPSHRTRCTPLIERSRCGPRRVEVNSALKVTGPPHPVSDHPVSQPLTEKGRYAWVKRDQNLSLETTELRVLVNPVGRLL